MNMHCMIASLTDWLGNDIEHLENLNDVKRLLNPNSIEVANKVADFLLEIEKKFWNMKYLMFYIFFIRFNGLEIFVLV